uniref:Uncharacterized protein n=1 Tax=Cannabis sativa TaxID=3483 RepID=A0A803QD82_CANSA
MVWEGNNFEARISSQQSVGVIRKDELDPQILVERVIEPKEEVEEANSNVLAWSHADMTGISLHAIFHALNINPNTKPIRQKQRPLDPTRLEAVKTKVDKFTNIDFLREALYPAWLPNPISVPKPNRTLSNHAVITALGQEEGNVQLQVYYSSHDSLKKQVVVADDLGDQVKVLEKKVIILEDERCFAIESFEESNFTVNVGESVSGEASGVEGYNLEHPNIRPSIHEAPPGESKGREETLIDVTGLQDHL